MSFTHNLAGSRFGLLVAIRPTGERRRKQIVWECKCDCGIVKNIPSYSLTSGAVVSCSCYGRSILGAATRTHGGSSTPEYDVWLRMKQRCYDESVERYPNYGGRGIKVCERWLHSFANFLADMGKKPSGDYSLERNDNDGDYAPDNCKWATRLEQANNKSTNRFLTSRGVTLTLAQWARQLGIPDSTIRRRLNRGLTEEMALR